MFFRQRSLRARIALAVSALSLLPALMLTIGILVCVKQPDPAQRALIMLVMALTGVASATAAAWILLRLLTPAP